MMKRDPQLIQPIADMIEEKIRDTEQEKDLEDQCVLLLLRGVCAKHLKNYETAIQSLSQVAEMQDEASLKRSYVVPLVQVDHLLSPLAILVETFHEKVAISLHNRFLFTKCFL